MAAGVGRQGQSASDRTMTSRTSASWSEQEAGRWWTVDDAVVLSPDGREDLVDLAADGGVLQLVGASFSDM